METAKLKSEAKMLSVLWSLPNKQNGGKYLHLSHRIKNLFPESCVNNFQYYTAVPN